MTALVGGLRVLNANFRQSKDGVFTNQPETLTNDFFVNLLGMNTEWKASTTAEGVFEGHDRLTGEINGPAPASILSSVQTPSSELSRKFMQVTTRRRRL